MWSVSPTVIYWYERGNCDWMHNHSPKHFQHFWGSEHLHCARPEVIWVDIKCGFPLKNFFWRNLTNLWIVGPSKRHSTTLSKSLSDRSSTLQTYLTCLIILATVHIPECFLAAWFLAHCHYPCWLTLEWKRLALIRGKPVIGSRFILTCWWSLKDDVATGWGWYSLWLVDGQRWYSLWLVNGLENGAGTGLVWF